MPRVAPRPRPASMLVTPVFALSVGTLLLNDRVLKSAWPGLITGKLSDVAGVAMMAILLTAATRRPAVGFGSTALGFTLLKTFPIAAIAAAPILGGVTRTDPTDLVALCVLPPLWKWVRRPRARANVDRRGWIVVAQVAAVSTAVFATTATSCEPSGVTGVVGGHDGSISALGADAMTIDGGRSWTLSSGVRDAEETAASPGGSPMSTVAGQTYELVRNDEGTHLVKRVGGTESVLFTADWRAVERLDDLDPPTCSADPFQGVAATEVADEPHAVVGMGGLGVIHIGPDDVPEWVAVRGFGVQETDASSQPLGIEVASPIGTKGFGFAVPPQTLLLMYLAAALLPFAAIPFVIVVARRRNRPFTGAVWWYVGSGLVLAAIWGLMALLGPLTGSQGRLPTAVALVVLGVAIANVAPVLLWHRRPGPPRMGADVAYPNSPSSAIDGACGLPLRPPRAEERVGD